MATTRTIRVLLAEDSATARFVLRSLIEQQTDMVVIGEAVNGDEAIALTAKLRPDIVVMDVYMPRLDGIEATRRIMQQTPVPIVIVSSRLNHEEHPLAFEAQRHGALRVVQKPEGLTAANLGTVAAEFTDLLRTLASVRVIRRYDTAESTLSTASNVNLNVNVNSITGSATTMAAAALPLRVDGVGGDGRRGGFGRAENRVVGIGASTGGPAALEVVLMPLPADFPWPIVVTQHITPGFVEGFAKWLDGRTALSVRVATAGEPLRPGTVLIAPDEHHLEVDAGCRIRLTTKPPVRNQRPSVTVMFESMAHTLGAAVMAVQLTGMGDDGADGCAAIEAAGGTVIVQEANTCVVSSMPVEAQSRCHHPHVTPLSNIAPQLLCFAQSSRH